MIPAQNAQIATLLIRIEEIQRVHGLTPGDDLRDWQSWFDERFEQNRRITLEVGDRLVPTPRHGWEPTRVTNRNGFARDSYT